MSAIEKSRHYATVSEALKIVAKIHRPNDRYTPKAAAFRTSFGLPGTSDKGLYR
jgi:hypothetical protein